MIIVQKPLESKDSFDLDNFTAFSEGIKKSVSDFINKSETKK